MNYQEINYKDYLYGGYGRKSSDSEDRQIQSIPKQIGIIEDDITKNNLNCIKIFSEQKSAFYRNNRPKFDELVDATEKGEINAWICLDSTRLSRNPTDAGTVIRLMDEGDLHHIRTRHRVYTNTARDKKNLQDEFTDNKFDSGRKSEDVRLGLNERYKKGLPNGKATLGFLNDKTQEKGNRGWLIDEDNFEKITLIIKRFLKGNDSISTIHKYAIDELKLTTPQTKRQGGNLVHRSHVYNVLTNPVYAGFFYSKNEDGIGETKRTLSPALPRIITEDEHNKILSILGRKSFSTTQTHEYAYTNYIFSESGDFIGGDPKHQVICDCKKKFAYKNKEVCPACNIKIDKMKSPKYLSYTYYYNVKRRKNKEVKAKTVSESKIDTFLKNYIDKELLLSPQLAGWVCKHINHLKDEELKANQTVFNSQESSMGLFEKEKKKLRDMYRKDMIDEDEYNLDLADLEKKYCPKKNKKQEYVSDWFKELNNIVDLGVEMKNIIEHGTIKEKKEVMSRFRSNLIWNEENLNVSNVSWVNKYIKGRKRILSKYPSFEPRNNVANKGKNTDLTVLCPTLLQLAHKFRTQNWKKIKSDLQFSQILEMV